MSAVVLLWDLFELPQLLNFSSYAFNDPGSNLTINYLVSHGYRPLIDFGYPYGLLSLLVNLVWFHAISLTPAGYQAASVLCQLGVACALARTARALEFGPLPLIFLFVVIGRAVTPTYWNLSHGLEAVLICLALSEQARGSRANALALTTAAVFAKPTMGYVYSALLLMFIALCLYRRRTFVPAAWLIEIKRAAIVGISLCAILGIVFGVRVLWLSVFPISGLATYRARNFGFFTGTGSLFWRPVGANWHYYAGSVIGMWAVATVYLIWGSIPASLRVWENLGTTSDSIETRRDEIVFSCALLHLAFIVFLFGNPVAWNSYSYLLIAGAAAVPFDFRLRRYAFCALIVVAIATYYSIVAGSISFWRSMSRSPATADLWSFPQMRDEWTRILTLSKGRRVAAFHYAGAAELMYPQFEPPVGTYFCEGLMPPVEIQREIARIDAADIIVLPADTSAAFCNSYPDIPEAHRALASFKQTSRGEYFSVYERSR